MDYFDDSGGEGVELRDYHSRYSHYLDLVDGSIDVNPMGENEMSKDLDVISTTICGTSTTYEGGLLSDSQSLREIPFSYTFKGISPYSSQDYTSQLLRGLEITTDNANITNLMSSQNNINALSLQFTNSIINQEHSMFSPIVNDFNQSIYEDIPEKSPIKRRRSFTASEKLAIIEEAATLGYNKTQKKYHIQGTQISKWRKKAEALRKLTLKNSRAARVITAHRSERFPEVEDWVYCRYYKAYMKTNSRIPASQLQAWAREASSSPELKSKYGDKLNSSVFTSNWVSSFKKRYKLPGSTDAVSVPINIGANNTQESSSQSHVSFNLSSPSDDQELRGDLQSTS